MNCEFLRECLERIFRIFVWAEGEKNMYASVDVLSMNINFIDAIDKTSHHTSVFDYIAQIKVDLYR